MGKLESEQRFEDEQVTIARRNGFLGREEQVNCTLSLYMNQVRPLWQKALLFPIRFLIFRKRYLLAVTDNRLVLCSVAAYKFREGHGESFDANLPCTLQLSHDAEPTQQRVDYKLNLPLHLADFAGGSFLYTSSDVKAASIIKLASLNRSIAVA